MSEVEREVLKIVADKASLDVSQLDLAARLADLNIASLDVVEIVFALEEKFDIQIPFNANKDRAAFDTVGDVLKAVVSLVAEKG